MQPKEIVKNLETLISKNSPTILTWMAVGGLATTVIFTYKAAIKSTDILESYREEQDDGEYVEPTPLETVKLTWKVYLPAAAMGTATICCIVGANHISLRRNAALVSLYGLTEAAFKEYQTKVVETIGKNKELKVRDDISADRVKNNPVNSCEVISTGKGEFLCYDTVSGRYFKSDIEQIRRVINEFNSDLLKETFKSLNDLYYSLGLSNIKYGEEMGWDANDGLLVVNFSTQLTEGGEPCLVMNYDVGVKYS